jgi:hypothetical protein
MMSTSSDPFGYAANPLRQSRRDPISAQGEITGKALIDYSEVQDRRENSADHHLLAKSYPGGNNDDNLMVMPGELVFAPRNRESVYSMAGEPNEYGLSSMAGLYYGRYQSDDAMMRDYYFVGVAKTEFRVGNSDQPESGFAVLKAGSYTTTNNGPYDIYPGDLIGYRFPLNTLSPGWGTDDRSQKLTGKDANSMDRIVPQNRAGTPNGKYLAEIVPFDYTDFKTSTAGALVAMKLPSADKGGQGIAGLSMKDFDKNTGDRSNRQLSNIQEEAMGYKFGIAGIVLRGIESLLRQGVALNDATQVADAIGIFRNDPRPETSPWFQMMSDIFLYDQVPGSGHYNTSKTAFEAAHQAATDYKYLSRHCMRFFQTGVASSWYHKSNRVLGKALNRARPTESLNAIFGHYRRL